MLAFQRGQVFQVGSVVPNVGWELQPDLVYVLGAATGVQVGKRVGRRVRYTYTLINLTSTDTSKWEPRGTINETDLVRYERKVTLFASTAKNSSTVLLAALSP